MLETILDVLWDALKDSLLILPVLFVCYLLIELLEERVLNKYQTSKGLKGKWAPVVSAGFGLIPQCGFSVVATDLYSKRVITLGSLFAIYLATSDEALPILLSNPNNYLDLVLILLIKFVYAVFVGLIIDLILRKRVSTVTVSTKKEQAEDSVNKEKVYALNDENIQGCCNHKLEHDKQSKFKAIFVHPLVHSLKIFAYILIINIAFGFIIAFVGEDAISNFMLSTGFFEPFIVAFVGLIPNCAASVIITEIFMMGSIGLGSCIAGLCVNSGLALIMLFKMNKNIKENFIILSTLYALSCAIGILINIF